MATSTPDPLVTAHPANDAGLSIEERKLRLEERRLQLDNRWFVRMFPALVTAAVSIAGVLLTCSQFHASSVASDIADSTRRLEARANAVEADRTWRLAVLKYVTDNIDRVTSPDSLKRNAIRAAMLAALPDSIAYAVFASLERSAPQEAKSTWTAGRSAAARAVGRRIYVQYADNKNTDAVKVLIADLREAGWNALPPEHIGNQTKAQIKYFYPDDSAMADSLAIVIGDAFKTRNIGMTLSTVLTKGFGDRVPPGQLEVWLPRF